MMSTYNISEFSKIVGVPVKTLQRWDREKRLIPNRTPTNRRVYTDDHLAQALGVVRTKLPRMTLAYARVSRQAQRPDLVNQVRALKQFCDASGIQVDEWIQEIGGGLNFKRKKFLWLVDMLVAGRVGCLVIAHQDRLVRFGFSLIEHFCQVQQCDLIVLNTESLSPEQEMVQELMTIVHCFSSRLSGLGNYRKSLKEALSHAPGPQDTTESNA